MHAWHRHAHRPNTAPALCLTMDTLLRTSCTTHNGYDLKLSLSAELHHYYVVIVTLTVTTAPLQALVDRGCVIVPRIRHVHIRTHTYIRTVELLLPITAVRVRSPNPKDVRARLSATSTMCVPPALPHHSPTVVVVKRESIYSMHLQTLNIRTTEPTTLHSVSDSGHRLLMRWRPIFQRVCMKYATLT